MLEVRFLLGFLIKKAAACNLQTAASIHINRFLLAIVENTVV
mgnify:CR=1 FL=1